MRIVVVDRNGSTRVTGAIGLDTAAQLACLVPHRFAAAGAVAPTVPGTEQSLRSAGPWSRCAGVLETRVPLTAFNGVASTVTLAEDRAHLGESTRKRVPYATPDTTVRRIGWPTSTTPTSATVSPQP